MTAASLRIVVDRNNVTVSSPDKDILTLVDRACSYLAPGHEHSPKFKDGFWDGYVRASKKVSGGRRAPRGLLFRILNELGLEEDDVQYASLDQPAPIDHGCWGPLTPFAYQTEGVAAAGRYQRGILLMSIRSGKTLLAANLTYHARRSTLYVVPNDLLLRQGFEDFSRDLPEANITMVGGGEDDASGDIVISTIQVLSRRREENPKWWRNFRARFDLLIIDEVHRLCGAGKEWRETLLDISALNRFGLSGSLRTITEDQEVWAAAVAGPVIHEVSMDDMVKEERLTPSEVVFVTYDTPADDAPQGEHWSKTYKRTVVDCEARNKTIVELARRQAIENERLVLIDIFQVGHARNIMSMLRAAHIPAALMTGKKSGKTEERWEEIKRFLTGKEYRVLVTNLLGEGVNLPELEVIINAEGGGDSHASLQRQRNMTYVEGKKATTYELADFHHPRLEKQTFARLNMYRRHPKAFPVVRMEEI